MEIRVGGVPAQMLGVVSDVEVTRRQVGGSWELSWQMTFPPGVQPPQLVAGARVDMSVAGPYWTGQLSDPDWDAGTFTAEGACRQAETVMALASGGDPALSAAAAVTAAVARGAVDWTVTAESVAEMIPYPDPDVVSLDEKLTEYTDLASFPMVWQVDPARVLRTLDVPTAPTLFVPPGILDIGSTTDTQVTHLFVKYYTLTATEAWVSAATGATGRRIEKRVDFRKKGMMSATQAQALADGLARRLGPFTKLTSSLELSAGQVVGPGGQPVHLSEIVENTMIRVHGMTDPRTGAASTDFVIGETMWKVSDRKVQATPVDAVTDDLTTLVADRGGEVL